MTLSMKTYKGYNKLPYCNVHYPTTKFTAVADTPENLRLQKNTNNQSGVVYQKDFIKEKSKFTTVADDPETMRLKKSQTQASHVQYKGEVAGQPSNFVPAEAGHIDQGDRKLSNAAPISPMAQESAPAPAAAAAAAAAAAVAAAAAAAAPTLQKYVALYDYTAADEDEVSFNEGDNIIYAEVIDDGWMTGTVERTGSHGMLPSNYVELQ